MILGHVTGGFTAFFVVCGSLSTSRSAQIAPQHQVPRKSRHYANVVRFRRVQGQTCDGSPAVPPEQMVQYLVEKGV